MKSAKLLLFVLMTCTFADDQPGLRLRLTKHALNGMLELLKGFAKHLTGEFARQPLEIPEGVQFTGPNVESNVDADMELKFEAPNNLLFTAKGGELAVSFDVTEKNSNGAINAGKVKFTIGEANMAVGLDFSKMAGGKLGVSLAKCTLQLGRIQVETAGFEADSTVVQRSKRLETRLKRTLRMACAELEMAIGYLQVKDPCIRGLDTPNWEWTKMALVEADMSVDLPSYTHIGMGYKHVGPTYRMNVSIVNQPKATADYMDVDISGLIRARGPPGPQWAYRPAPLAEKQRDSASRMVHIFVADELYNQLLREMHRTGTLDELGTLPKSYNEMVKSKMVEKKDQLGWDVLPEDEVFISVSFPTAPQATFGDASEAGLTLRATVEVRLRQARAARQLSDTRTRLKMRVRHTSRLEETADRAMPLLKESGQVEELQILSMDGLPTDFRLTPTGKNAIETALRELMNDLYSRSLEMDNWEYESAAEKLENGPVQVRLRNVLLRFLERTAETAFNVDVDEQQLFQFKTTPRL